MVILGIDPGFDRMGCAVLEKSRAGEKLIYSVCLMSDKKAPHAERLFSIGREIEKIIKKHKPDILAIEKLFFTKNQKTAMMVSEARGMVLFLAAAKKLEIKEYTPLEIKIALTGYGKAEKRQVQEMVKAVLKMPVIPKSDDEVDAIACALTCSAQCRL
ncbi:MAG: crossover junction endodeoxyribonuclease RuvC [bacterium]|nr:crossover junction endodeoxyribonuclease RuvC [bacterium]